MGRASRPPVAVCAFYATIIARKTRPTKLDRLIWSKSMISDSYKGMVDEVFKDGEALRIAHGYLMNMSRGFYNQELVDAVVQKYINRYDIYDAYTFMQIWGLLGTGHCLHCKIYINETPDSDKETESNNLKLKNLPHPFYGEFEGGPGDDDGILGWSDEIDIKTEWDEKYSCNYKVGITVPLEVGYTEAFTTLFHICHSGGVARWAYQSKFVYLFLINKNIPWPSKPFFND